MCNKILWLDHGRQILFTDQVDLALDAYEEFLATKHLPGSMEDIRQYAAAFALRRKKEQEKKEKKKVRELEKVLESKEDEAAVQAAVAILRRSRPDLLAESPEGTQP